MHIEVIRSYLEYFLLFTGSHCLLWTAICGPTARFHFYKDQFAFMLGHEVDFAALAAKVALQDVISLAHQRLPCHAFTRSAQTLACGFLLLSWGWYRTYLCSSGILHEISLSSLSNTAFC